MDTTPLGDLVRLARSGDARAWRTLAGRFYPSVLGIARRRLSGSSLAEDAVQEAFLAAFCALASLREPESFPAWMAAIVRNQCTRLALGQHPVQSLDDVSQDGAFPLAETGDPAQGLHEARLRAAFDAALKALPGHLREAARRHYGQGQTSRDIAAALGLGEGTVKKRLHAAREILREKMLPYGGAAILRVGYMPITDHLLPMAAQELFRDRPLPVAPRRYLSWQALTADLRQGRVDAAFIMAPLAMRLAARGADLVHVMDAHHDGSSLSVSAQGPMRRLGLPAPYSTHQVLLDHLAAARPELADLSLSVISPSYAISSMRAKKIDAFFCAEPWGAKCVQEKLGRTMLFSKDILPGHTCCILAVRRDFASRHGEVVRKYVRTLLAARDRVRDDPVLGAGILAACTGVARDVAHSVLSGRLVTFDDLRPRPERMEVFLPMMRRDAPSAPPGPAFDLGRFVCPDFA
ncbi:sigma-70 family RNA polymerase sigma factor [Desulfovibrio sulfodismutans]|uniref:Sigma-70 family RNA polymerase sigma factor n=1 Tax=Desulfolutivibrio sulfodismutans TaxID=63561 RepID=A0A7K3NQQ6_9BACT|nr:sigma-70 family RNA polymerase sigma factor [Desulfolutivibrio sulfodismutans]NDY58544.1 sigma-70 family RNA polymerase sigma factor [Desulfolutivibrio sulfodismutans]QLA13913.1 sigma-70 family RNA polymerase sigma factor [Desulfolutivibrio sulfodismutans DSM 3696]